MGVSGAGKTVIGRLWAEKLECDFLEGDRRHPPENILKMESDIPLEDKDRYQWLQEIEEDIKRAIKLDRETVITCSALKASYRKQLKSWGQVQLVWIDVQKSELQQRLNKRNNHYMKLEMLDSQLAAFESLIPEEDGISINGMNSPVKVIEELFDKARKKFPTIEKHWWHRSNF